MEGHDVLQMPFALTTQSLYSSLSEAKNVGELIGSSSFFKFFT